MRYDDETAELEEQLAEARAQIESLQASAADAEARAATARGEVTAANDATGELRAQLAESEAARDGVQGELSVLQSDVTGLRSQLREAAAKYREVRLSSAPDVPHDLVPELETIEEVDREFEAAQRVVGQLREKIEREAGEQKRSVRVPPGSPARRPADTSALSAGEKIRLGLQQADERQGR